MKNAVVAWFAVLSWTLPLSVLAADEKKEALAETQAEKSPLLEASKMREQLATAIMRGGEDIVSALVRLRAHPAPTGLGLSRESEYAFAVVEIGHRLIAANRPKEAEAFFREAEAALGRALEPVSEEKTHERVLILRKRALVRSQFLGKGIEAKADLKEAIRLRPEDQSIIERQRDYQLSGYGELNRPETRN